MRPVRPRPIAAHPVAKAWNAQRDRHSSHPPRRTCGVRTTGTSRSLIFLRNVLRLSPRRRAARNWFPRVAPSASEISGRSTSEMTRSYMPSGGSRSPCAANSACRWRSTASVSVTSLAARPSAAAPARAPGSRRPARPRSSRASIDLFGVERRQAAHQVLELAHVARPAMLLQPRPSASGRSTLVGRPSSRRALAGSGGPARECPRAARAAAAGGSARRSAGRTDPRGTGPAGSARRRSRWVAAMMRTLALIGCAAADRRELALLQHAQQPGLRLGRHVADLVEEQRAAGRLLEPARRALDRAGEGAALVAEQLALDQLARDRRQLRPRTVPSRRLP